MDEVRTIDRYVNIEKCSQVFSEEGKKKLRIVWPLFYSPTTTYSLNFSEFPSLLLAFLTLTLTLTLTLRPFDFPKGLFAKQLFIQIDRKESEQEEKVAWFTTRSIASLWCPCTIVKQKILSTLKPISEMSKKKKK